MIPINETVMHHTGVIQVLIDVIDLIDVNGKVLFRTFDRLT